MTSNSHIKYNYEIMLQNLLRCIFAMLIFSICTNSYGQAKIDFPDVENNLLMSIIDEGIGASIQMNSSTSTPYSIFNKMYNASNTLFFNGTPLASNWNSFGLELYSLNNVGIGLTEPEATLHLNGTFRYENNPVANYVLTSDAAGNASWQAFPTGEAFPWVTSSGDIYRNTANVGIGTTDPQSSFHLNSNFRYSVSPTLDHVLVSDASGNAIWKAPNDAFPKQWTEDGNDIYRADGQVGIGVDEPLQDLHVANGVRVENGIFQSGSELSGWRFRDFEGTTHMRISPEGKVGMGTLDPKAGLHVVNDKVGTDNQFVYFSALFRNTKDPNGDGVEAQGIAILAGRSQNSGANSRIISFFRPEDSNSDGVQFIAAIVQDKTNVVAYNTGSDIRWKENIEPSQYGLSSLMGIKVVDYNFIGFPNESVTGYLAQQLFEHYPEAVHQGGKDEHISPWMIEYGALTPLITKAIQAQSSLLEKVGKENQELRAQKMVLLNQLQALENSLISIKERIGQETSLND